MPRPEQDTPDAPPVPARDGEIERRLTGMEDAISQPGGNAAYHFTQLRACVRSTVAALVARAERAERDARVADDAAEYEAQIAKSVHATNEELRARLSQVEREREELLRDAIIVINEDDEVEFIRCLGGNSPSPSCATSSAMSCSDAPPAASRSVPEGPTEEETVCWLIERSQPEGFDPPQYLRVGHAHIGWTLDATKAKRFASRDLARAFQGTCSDLAAGRPCFLCGHVAEHVFLAASRRQAGPTEDA
jgi:hypothetical protein